MLTILVLAAASRAPNGTVVGGRLTVGSLECDLCVEALDLAIDVINGKVEDKVAMGVANEFCLLNGGGLGYTCTGEWQCQDLCSIVYIFAPVLFKALDGVLDPKVECVRLGMCPPSDPSAYPPGYAAWRRARPAIPYLPAPPPVKVQRPVAPPAPVVEQPLRRQAGVLNVLHMTDMHVGPNYKAGGWTACGQPSCCRDVPYSGEDKKVPDTTAGYWGDYGCDLPPATWQAALAKMRTLVGGLDFAVVTGDDPPHNVWDQTQPFNQNRTLSLSADVAAALAGVPVFPALGNHAAFPVNMYNTDISQDVGWLYAPAASAWRRFGWIDDPAVAQVETLGGSYAMQVPNTGGKWRVVSLNTNLWDGDDWWSWGDDRSATHADLGNVSNFARAQLAAARAAGAKAIVISHRPTTSLYDYRAHEMADIIREFSDVVPFMLSGHTHQDQEHVLYDANGQPLVMQYEAGAVTTFTNINPSFRVYSINATTGAVIDYTQYRFDIAAQGHLHNPAPGNPPVFNVAYTAKAAYQMPDLSAASWATALKRMRTDDAMFAQWWSNTNCGVDVPLPDASGRESALCDALSSEPADAARLGCKRSLRNAGQE